MKKICSAHIVAIIFGIVLIIGISGFFNVKTFLKPIYSALFFSWDSEKSAGKNISAIEKNIESIINDNVGMKNEYIEINGLAQKLVGKKLIEDADVSSRVIKLKNGHVTFAWTRLSDEIINDSADKITGLKEFLDDRGTDFLFVQSPYKNDDQNPLFPVGIEDYSIDNSMRFVSALREKNINTLNLIDRIREDNLDWYSLFFKTDHHWTNEAGFWAYGELAQYMNDNFGYNIDRNSWDINNYTVRTYEGAFLGSQGKRTGSLFAGVDDISFLIPKFETSLVYNNEIKGIYRTGTFEQTLLFEKENISGSLYDDFCYAASLNGDFGLLKLTNNLDTSGKKVMIIKDSFANPVITFLAPNVSEITVVDMRLLKGETGKTLREVIEESNPDTVIMLYNHSQISKPECFDFGI
ncbi:MAG: hypothetical protein IKU25_07880 [Clostridia bacterium]|nr:hypothetical protein [Clostridia bacterium]